MAKLALCLSHAAARASGTFIREALTTPKTAAMAAAHQTALVFSASTSGIVGR